MHEQVHVTLGHTTVMAEAQYFGLPDSSRQTPASALASTISRIGHLALNVSPTTHMTEASDEGLWHMLGPAIQFSCKFHIMILHAGVWSSL